MPVAARSQIRVHGVKRVADAEVLVACAQHRLLRIAFPQDIQRHAQAKVSRAAYVIQRRADPLPGRRLPDQQMADVGAEEILLIGADADVLERRGNGSPGALQAHGRVVRRGAGRGGQTEQNAPGVGIESHGLHDQQLVHLARLLAQAAAAETKTYNYNN